MTLAECQETIDVSRVKVEEEGKKAVFVNLERKTFVKTKVDGCLCTGETACDWVVTHDDADLFIELKGTDVDHGLSQIFCTARYWIDNGFSSSKLAALVVCCRYPRVSTGIQRAKLRFRRDFKGPLTVVSKNLEFTFKDLFVFG
jgi:hypothetical protein